MIIITGANGFIGSQMTLFCEALGFEIVGVDPVSRNERPAPLKDSLCRLLPKEDLWKFLETEEVKKELKWIIHMGANSSTTEKNWDVLKENNLEYTQRIWVWCADHKIPLIYASSAATYGAGEKGYDDTTDPGSLKALNLYGRSKLEFDQWALRQTKTPPHWYGLKFFNVYGPQETHKGAQASVATKAFHQILQNGHMTLFKSDKPEYKDGAQMRDFIYVKDICLWMKELMEKRPASGVYNMGTGKARTWIDLATAVFNALGKPVDIRFMEMPAELKGQYQYFTEAKMEKWKAQGLSDNRYSLEAGVKDYKYQVPFLAAPSLETGPGTKENL